MWASMVSIAVSATRAYKWWPCMGRYKRRSPKFVGSLQEALHHGAQTDRTHHSIGYDGIDPTRMALAKALHHRVCAVLPHVRDGGR